LVVVVVVAAVADGVATSVSAPERLLGPVWSPYSGAGGPGFAPLSAGSGWAAAV